MKAPETRYTETLDYCDGIQLFAAEDVGGGNYVSVLVAVGKEADRYLVVGCEPESLTRLRSGAIDLKHLVEGSARQEWYLADVTGFGEAFGISL